MPTTLQARDIRLDLLRIFTTCTVIGVHFFLNNGFYQAPLLGGRMFLMTMLRYACMVCVPSFMILTGYLSWKKTLRPGYWKGLVPILGVYLIASVGYALFRLVRSPGSVSPISFLRGVLDYSATYYSWYVGFYIGFCLLIPFLNLMYHGLTSQRQKQVLLLVLLALTSLPSVTNLFFPLLPAFWTSMYPLTYYFIGCYLHDYPPQVGKVKLFLLFSAVAGVTALYSYWKSQGGVFQGFSNWGDLPILLLSTLFAMFFLALPANVPAATTGLLTRLSSLAFGAYLASSIADQTLYPWLLTHFSSPHLLLPFFLPVVLCSILCSFALSWVYNTLYTLIATLLTVHIRKRP